MSKRFWGVGGFCHCMYVLSIIALGGAVQVHYSMTISTKYLLNNHLGNFESID